MYLLFRIEKLADHSRSIAELPDSVTALLECPDPNPKPTSPVYPTFGLLEENEVPITVKLQDFAWLLARNLSRTPEVEAQQQAVQNDNQPNTGQEEEGRSAHVPVWSGYNSLINNMMPTTRVGAPPLIAAPAHEWKTLLTIVKQAQKIPTQVDKKTVISLDMGLYQPAKKLQMAQNDLSHLILRPGELHIVMAQLRTIGAFIENSGLDMCWTESELYGPATVKQILDGNHVKRGETAHLVTLQALFVQYQNAFFQSYREELKHLEELSRKLADVCANGTKDELKKRTPT